MHTTVIVRVPRDHRDIGLRLGVVIEPDRPPAAHVPPGSERRHQGPRGFHDRRVVGGTLGLGDQEIAVDELDLLVGLEDA